LGSDGLPKRWRLEWCFSGTLQKWETLARFLLEPEPPVEGVLLTGDEHERLKELPEVSIGEEALREGIYSNDIIVEKIV